MVETCDNCVIGHPLEGPSGERLNVPLWVYRELQKRGLKKRYSIKVSPAIYSLLKDPRLHTLTSTALRHVLGFGQTADGKPELQGPGTWLQCDCAQCRKMRGLRS